MASHRCYSEQPSKTECLIPIVDSEHPAYPAELKAEEDGMLKARRSLVGLGHLEKRGPAGIALSGGGIRSATLSLGVFQALAKSQDGEGMSHLRFVDYLSTVSGGGYFGGFLGRMFCRDTLPTREQLNEPPGSNPDDVTLEDVAETLSHSDSECVRRLRENGRYLAPNGFGDLLIATTVVLRNWLSVLVMVVLPVLALLLILNLVRMLLDLAHGFLGWGADLFAGTWVHMSPWVLVPAALFVIAVIPLGWAYWLIPYTGGNEGPGRLRYLQVPLLLASSILLGFVWPAFGHRSSWVGGLGVTIALFTIFWHVFDDRLNPQPMSPLLKFLSGKQVPWRRRDARKCTPSEEEVSREEQIEDARNRLSRRMKTWLVAAAAILGIALIDTAGQWLFIRGESVESLTAAFASWAAVVSGVVAFSRKISALIPEREERPSVPRSLMYYGVAFLLLGGGLVILSGLAHAITWQWLRPAAEVGYSGIFGARRVVSISSPSFAPAPLAAVALLIGGAIAVGSVWPFVNRSSMHAFYEARLRRAYLGASNPGRRSAMLAANHGADGISVMDYEPEKKGGPLHIINVTINETVGCESQIQQRDRKGVGMAVGPAGISRGVSEHSLWLRGESEPTFAATLAGQVDAAMVKAIGDLFAPEAKKQDSPTRQPVSLGALLATLNEAEMALPQGSNEPRQATGRPIEKLGPYLRVSALGRRHKHKARRLLRKMGVGRHEIGRAVRFWDGEGETLRDLIAIPEVGEKELNRFGDLLVVSPYLKTRPEPLDLGQWLAVSGAAFSTGIGSRTSLALSLLAGLFNIRLGYWWDSDLDRSHRRYPLPVYASLGREWLGQFQCHSPGDRWYLTDGGHAENTGGYELLRRKLPFVVVFDNEQDADSEFSGLANLVRRIRIDFDTHVQFLDDDELNAVLGDTDLRRHIGTLEHLRRGKWTNEPFSEHPGRHPHRLDQPDQDGHSLAHAALAKIEYRSPDPPGTGHGILLYVKPTLLGDEPVDILRYHTAHPSFPHEATTDQFFDEEQWESYRRLGEHIATTLFAQYSGLHWSPLASLEAPGLGRERFLRLLPPSTARP